jgi:pyruvate/2-oxoglutarate dehydrogenase complex dihydrolipoamide dehydrogenase (E3) component
MDWEQSAVNEVFAQESPETLRTEGIDVLEGRAEFQDSRILVVGQPQVSARRFLICTGAAPFIPSIPGLKDTPYLTYETFWDLAVLPD